MDYEGIAEVEHVHSDSDVNRMLRNGWVILCVAPGRHEEGDAYILYSMGKKKDTYADAI